MDYRRTKIHGNNFSIGEASWFICKLPDYPLKLLFQNNCCPLDCFKNLTFLLWSSHSISWGMKIKMISQKIKLRERPGPSLEKLHLNWHSKYLHKERWHFANSD